MTCLQMVPKKCIKNVGTHWGKYATETYFNLLCGMTISTTGLQWQENMLFRQNVCSFTPVNGFEEIQ